MTDSSRMTISSTYQSTPDITREAGDGGCDNDEGQGEEGEDEELAEEHP